MDITIRYIASCALFFFCFRCTAQNVAFRPELIKEYDKVIALGGFSMDTTSITFFKKDSWFVLYGRGNPMLKPLPQACNDCDKILTDAFIDNLLLFKHEPKEDSNCRVVIDTVFEGKPVVSISDFYLISDLEEQTISVKKGGKSLSVSYLAPRLALKYCKVNKGRLLFIRYSDILRNIK